MPKPKRLLSVVTLAALAALTAGCTAPGGAAATRPSAEAGAPEASAPSEGLPGDVEAALVELEERHDVTVGVSVHSAQGAELAYNADERFGYASTLKAFAGAALLATLSASGRSATVTWTQDDIDAAGYSPVTTAHLGDGLSLAMLAESAVRESDNTAMNLVMRAIGGPGGLEAFLRSLGDEHTLVSAEEPELNDSAPGEPAHTTTPDAFAAALQAVFEDDHLSADDALTLEEWMSGNATGDALIRASAPADWEVADKSGGAGGVRNDIAVVTTPAGERLFVAILTATNDPDASYDDAVVAEAASVVFEGIARR
ncbi:class A beta-lactamase [Microbacterium marinilacus]|uniref:Beta-lactamase n=1 Tax=Microbacterium marinilacus TaxID=415209 RepID=A0ABP7BJT0_9MICO|nr:class A beta-lactamase [Microbacterium marinilacus]MBY0688352.1 class A beta-lactamase [Microbacterium marinilacus]